MSRATGVSCDTFASVLPVICDPTVTRPTTIRPCESPLFFSSCAMPTVPPAPGTFETVTLVVTSFSSVSARWTSRAVVSKPPPVAAGAMMSIAFVGYLAAAVAAPDAVAAGGDAEPPHAAASSAAAARSAEMREIRLMFFVLPGPSYCAQTEGGKSLSRSATRSRSLRDEVDALGLYRHGHGSVE